MMPLPTDPKPTNLSARNPAAPPPKFSVVIPTYNAAPFIADTLNSVLAQTDPDFEVIVVNDGSTDNSREIVASFNDPRIKIVDRVNGGLATARNTGIWASTGELVAFIDADDRWLPGKLAAHRLALDIHPEASVSYDWAAFMDEAGNLTGLYMSQSRRIVTHQDLMIKNYLGNGSTFVVRRSVLIEHEGFDQTLARSEDRELWVRLTYYGHKIQLVPQVLTEYRQHRHSFTADTSSMLQGLEALFDRINRYAPQSVIKYKPLARACMHRWIARAAFVDHNYETARDHMRQSLAASIWVLWYDPRALLTFTAIAMQSILPASWFDKCLNFGMALISRWFRSQPHT
jgi:glycosyltransferase involved in cell wall biosynthesis